MEQRREELRKGLVDTPTRQTLKEFKPVADLFNFIQRASADIKKITVRMTGDT